MNNVRYSNIENIDKYIENINQGDFNKNKIIQEVQNAKDKRKRVYVIRLKNYKWC